MKSDCTRSGVRGQFRCLLIQRIAKAERIHRGQIAEGEDRYCKRKGRGKRERVLPHITKNLSFH